MAAMRGAFPRAMARKAAIRWCSHWREATAPWWNRNSRAPMRTAGVPVSAVTSAASRTHSPSSAHSSTTGTSSRVSSPAAKCARWTGDRPDTSAGERPLSKAASRRRYSGTVFRMFRSCFMGYPQL